MKTSKILLLTSSILFLILIVFIACKKDKDEPIEPKVPTCDIIAPPDSTKVQLGSILSVEAEISGFGSEVKVAFSVDTAGLTETSASPYEFLWDTEGWSEGFHTVRADAYEGDVLVSDWITVELIDTIPIPMPPVAVIKITPNTGTTDTIFTFDASESYDPDDFNAALLYRWDFDGDDSWDTEFTYEQLVQHKYTSPQNYSVKLEVLAADSMSGDTIKSLLVEHSGTQDACEGFVTIPYGGQVYHTVPIGEQCWLRENMNIGDLVNTEAGQSNNEIIEKFCYDDLPENCEKYGGLYMWHEMMAYIPIQGSQGICPNGWHIPSDDEWKELEGYTDSQYGIGNPVWDENFYRGFDTGKRLKALLGWNNNGNGDNLYDFKAIPGGFWEVSTSFIREGEEAHFWTSSHDSGHNAVQRGLKDDKDNISRTFEWDETARSVRCLKD